MINEQNNQRKIMAANICYVFGLLNLMLKQHKNLISLNIANNIPVLADKEVLKSCMTQLADGLSTNKVLTTLNLSFNTIDSNIVVLIDALKENPKSAIKNLILSNNNLTDTDAMHFGSLLGIQQCLIEILDLSNNTDMIGTSYTDLASEVAKNKASCLKELYMQNKTILDEITKAGLIQQAGKSVQTLSHNKNLKTVVLNVNSVQLTNFLTRSKDVEERKRNGLRA